MANEIQQDEVNETKAENKGGTEQAAEPSLGEPQGYKDVPAAAKDQTAQQGETLKNSGVKMDGPDYINSVAPNNKPADNAAHSRERSLS